MKHTLLALVFGFVIAQLGWAQIDRSRVPLSDKAPAFEMPAFHKFRLDNGITVIVVENHKVPRVSFQLYFDAGLVPQADKAGLGDLYSELLMAGTESLSKDSLNATIDFLGADVAPNDRGLVAVGLSKHAERLFELMVDMQLHPAFPETDLELAKKQMLSSIQAAKENAGAIADNITKALIYGKNHPLGELATERSIEAVRTDDIRAYHQRFIRPEIGYLIVVGDLHTNQVEKLAKKYLGAWNNPTPYQKPAEMAPSEPSARVAVANKTGAVQSSLVFASTIDLKPASPDIFAVRLLESILGGGSDGRLYKNIREDKGYTYGAYCQFADSRWVGRFQASAEVRNAVSDSAAVEFRREFDRIRSTEVDADELRLHKTKLLGSFARNFERPETMARYALNTLLLGLPNDFYANYPEALMRVTAADVLAAARKYLRPEHLLLVAVGDAPALKKQLQRFANKPIVEYDFYAEPLENPSPKALPEGLTAQNVLDRYLQAVNAPKWEQTKTFHAIGELRADAMPLPMKVDLKLKPKQRLRMVVSMGFIPVSTQILNGKRAVRIEQGQQTDMSPTELLQTRMQAALVEETQYPSMGIAPQLTAIEAVEGEECYVLQFDKPFRKKLYYSIKTGLKLKEVYTQEGKNGDWLLINHLSDYRPVDGRLFPHGLRTQAGQQRFSIQFTEVKANQPIDDKEFLIEQ